MPVSEKKQCPIRLYPDQIKKIKAKVMQDKLTFQKLAEILFSAYLKDNKEIKRLVQRHADEKYARRRRYQLTDMEAEELLRRIAKESPYSEIDEAMEELDDEY